ncbi:MAG TPA: D-alanyl-D-alanine carboxypeptidase, partial [Methylibium sp.]
MLSVLCRAGLYLLLAVSSALACAAGLPPAVAKALKQARLPQDALVAVVAEAGRPERPRLSYQAELPVNPASLMKLFTTYAALDLLGPAYSWTTPVYLDGRVVNPGPVGVLEGSVYIQGRGDPTLVLERVWLLVQRLRQAGVREIRGDIVLDRSAFSVPDADPGDFDGEPYRPYNVRPDALLFNFKSLTLSFEPDASAGVARISVEPTLAGLRIDESVALANGPCEDWRSALKADFNDPARIRFGGGFAATCGERQWPLAYADPRSYNARLLIALWQGAGGLLSGQVREGTVPPGLKPAFEFGSPPLADAVRGINKFSNNTMAQQLFLTLGLTQ